MMLMMICQRRRRSDSEMPSHCHRHDDADDNALSAFLVRAFVRGKSGCTSSSSSSSRSWHKRHGEHHHHHSHARSPSIKCKRNARRTAILEYRANTHSLRCGRVPRAEEMCARSRITLTHTHTHTRTQQVTRSACGALCDWEEY